MTKLKVASRNLVNAPKEILKNRRGGRGVDFFHSEQRTVLNSYEHANESSGFIICGEFLGL